MEPPRRRRRPISRPPAGPVDVLGRALVAAAEIGDAAPSLLCLFMLDEVEVEDAVARDVGDLSQDELGNLVLTKPKVDMGGLRLGGWSVPLHDLTAANILAHIQERREGPLLVGSDGERIPTRLALVVIYALVRPGSVQGPPLRL